MSEKSKTSPQDGASAVLPLVGGPLGALVERANAQVPLVAVGHVGVGTGLAGHVLVGHELRDALLEPRRVQVAAVVVRVGVTGLRLADSERGYAPTDGRSSSSGDAWRRITKALRIQNT